MIRRRQVRGRYRACSAARRDVGIDVHSVRMAEIRDRSAWSEDDHRPPSGPRFTPGSAVMLLVLIALMVGIAWIGADAAGLTP